MPMSPITGTTGDPVFRAQNNSINQIRRFTRVASDAGLKLNNQERIVNPGDDALAFQASRRIRSDIASLKVVTETAQLNVTGIGIAIDGLESVKSQLDLIKKTFIQAQASTEDERDLLQQQIDLAISSIDSTANNTKLGGRRLLNGDSSVQAFQSISNAGVITEFAGVSGGASLGGASGIIKVNINKLGVGTAGTTKTLNDGRTVLSINASIATSGQRAGLAYNVGGAAATDITVFRVTGKLGSATLTIASTGMSVAEASAFNAFAEQTGVVLNRNNATTAQLQSIGFTNDDFVKVEVLSATNATTDFGSAAAVGATAAAYGTTGTASFNGQAVTLSGEYGLTARFQENGFDIEVDFGAATVGGVNATTNRTLNVDLSKGITGVLGVGGGPGDAITYGIGSFTSATLGKGTRLYSVSESTGVFTVASGTQNNSIIGGDAIGDLGGDGALALATGNTKRALATLDRAIDEIVSEQTRLGLVQSSFIGAINNAEISIGNLSSADADIIGVDAATEITNLIQAQLGVSTSSSVLSQTNAIQANIFSLLRG